MKTFSVIYRTGGTENFRWNRVLATYTKEEARETQEALLRQGYPALVHNTAHLDAVGLPETYVAGEVL